jgi:transposase
VAFTSADRVRDVIHNFNADGFDSLCPKYRGGRPKTFTLPDRREIKKIAKSKPPEHGLPFSTWSLAKLALSCRQAADVRVHWTPAGPVVIRSFADIRDPCEGACETLAPD